LGEEESETNCEIILKFLKLVLNLWGDELNQRPEEKKQSMKGRVVSATHMQTVSYMKPLFRKLKRHDVSADILGCLIDIVKHLLKRDYLKANEAYLEMAIGNAPWPIGVTMVGIHARTGREKIFAKNVAHVLNDETQRKYIQGLKRLMTQAQKYFPTDPSKSVNYEPPAKSDHD
jgi:pre-mRNA-splicing factor 18